MTFETRLAKIGKGNNANLYLNDDNDLSIFLCTNSAIEKKLKLSKERYELFATENAFGYDEIIKVNETVYVARQGKIIKVLSV